MSAEDLEAMIEAAARVGYETIMQSQGMFINKHPWAKEPEDVKRDWRAAARAMYPILSQ